VCGYQRAPYYHQNFLLLGELGERAWEGTAAFLPPLWHCPCMYIETDMPIGFGLISFIYKAIGKLLSQKLVVIMYIIN